MQIATLVTEQAGKTILIGAMSAQEVITHLSNQVMAVNSEAQRSLARGGERESTKELLESDKVHKLPRTREFRMFLQRVVDQLRQGKNEQGFLGAIQIIVPEKFKGARLRRAEAGSAQLPANLALVLSALGRNRQLATFEAEPMLEEAVFHIGDGQGRAFSLYSLRKWVIEECTNCRGKLKRLQASDDTDTQEIEKAKVDLAEMEALRERVNAFLSQTHLPFVAYVSKVLEDGTVVGLSVDAEKRLYIEGNALNSKASQEEIIKYESNSPVVLALREERFEEENVWMHQEFIEEDSKTIGKNSTKLFTLSSLVQAYSFSMTNDNDPITHSFDEHVFELVAQRNPFVSAYWKRVSGLFTPVWVPDAHQKTAERRQYLQKRRAEQNVTFQAVFLLALGRLGFTLGVKAGWDPNSPELDKLKKLMSLDFRAKPGGPDDTNDADYNQTWRNAMMKAGKQGWVFNNSNDTVDNTFDVLCKQLGVTPQKAPKTVPTPTPETDEEAA